VTIDPAVLHEASRCIRPLEDALQKAATNPSQPLIEDLRDAIDSMMRALAGVLIELGHQP
jgi:hypothetical protein